MKYDIFNFPKKLFRKVLMAQIVIYNSDYFLAILGETLQRMSDINAKYSIALPHMKQFINLWQRLPDLAKQRTGITALFIDNQGNVIEML